MGDGSKRIRPVLLLFPFSLLVFTSFCCADVSVTTELSEKRLYLHDQLQVSVSIVFPQNEAHDIEHVVPVYDEFFIVDDSAVVTHVELRGQQAYERHVYLFTLRAQKTGLSNVGPFVIDVRDSVTDEVRRIKTERYSVEIFSQRSKILRRLSLVCLLVVVGLILVYVGMCWRYRACQKIKESCAHLDLLPDVIQTGKEILKKQSRETYENTLQKIAAWAQSIPKSLKKTGGFSNDSDEIMRMCDALIERHRFAGYAVNKEDMSNVTRKCERFLKQLEGEIHEA